MQKKLTCVEKSELWNSQSCIVPLTKQVENALACIQSDSPISVIHTGKDLVQDMTTIKVSCDNFFILLDEYTYSRQQQGVTIMPRGFTLHMTGYTPECTKSVEKGSFLDIWRRRRLLQKGYIFRC